MGRGQGQAGQAPARRARITNDVRLEYMAGPCRALAVALHDATGWPLVVVTDAVNVHAQDHSQLSDEERAGGIIGYASMSPQAIHALVEHPSGELLDIQGLNEPIGLVEAYEGAADEGGAALGYVSREDLLEEHEGTSNTVTVDEAARYVPELIDSLR
jgi:hypothetical protein